VLTVLLDSKSKKVVGELDTQYENIAFF